jgi:hypothetical protein
MGNRIADIEQAGYLRYNFWSNPVATDADVILPSTAQPASGTTVLTTGFTQPDVPRCLTVDGNQASCTGNLVVAGTDVAGNSIEETIAINGTTLVNGLKAFDTITSITIPARGASGDEIFVGVNDKLGLDRALPLNSVILATADGVYETTRPTVTYDKTELAKNTVDINTALDGAKDVMVLFADMRASEVAAA